MGGDTVFKLKRRMVHPGCCMLISNFEYGSLVNIKSKRLRNAGTVELIFVFSMVFAWFLHICFLISNLILLIFLVVHYREVPRWEILWNRNSGFGLDLGRLASLKKKHLGQL